MRNASLVADLNCFGCGRKLVEDGCFKCTRCKILVEATLGQKRIYCPNCSSPRVLLARNDEVLCPESKSRCSNRRENKGTPMKFAESEEREVVETKTQETVAEAPPADGSKTQELRDWLDAEIRNNEGDSTILKNAFAFPHGASYGPGEGTERYAHLTSDERESMMAKDRKKLEELKNRLELLRSAKELDVDVDAMEKMGFDVEVFYEGLKRNPHFYTATPVFIHAHIVRAATGERVEIWFSASSRKLYLVISDHIAYQLKDITRFGLNEGFHGQDLIWTYPAIGDNNEYRIRVTMPALGGKIDVRLDVRNVVTNMS